MTNFQRLGWVISAAMLGVLVAAGFQGSMQKVASVDLPSLVADSDLGKSNIAALDALRATYSDLIGFVDQNRVLTIDQAKKLQDLWLKQNPSALDKASLESLKADIVAAEKKNLELSRKPNLTAEERTQLQDYSTRSAATETLLNQWVQQFNQDFTQAMQQRQADTLAKARTAAQSVAKAQGYTLVFASNVAIYAANDLTQDALKAMNAQK